MKMIATRGSVADLPINRRQQYTMLGGGIDTIQQRLFAERLDEIAGHPGAQRARANIIVRVGRDQDRRNGGADRNQMAIERQPAHIWHLHVCDQARGNADASLIGRPGSSTFRLSTTAVSMSLTGSRFSSESAPGPFHHGSRERGGTIYWAALPSDDRRVQATKRTHLIHRPARDIIPRLGGTRVFSYCV